MSCPTLRYAAACSPLLALAILSSLADQAGLKWATIGVTCCVATAATSVGQSSSAAILLSSSPSPTASREAMAAKEVDFKIVPKVRAEDDEDEDEEELIDPAEGIKQACEAKNCQKYRDRYEECNTRVNSKKQTEETCVEEVLDLFHCVDHCASPKIAATFK